MIEMFKISTLEKRISMAEKELSELESIPKNSRSIMEKLRICLVRSALRDARQALKY